MYLVSSEMVRVRDDVAVQSVRKGRRSDSRLGGGISVHSIGETGRQTLESLKRREDSQWNP
jgi:hypothetical protein